MSGVLKSVNFPVADSVSQAGCEAQSSSLREWSLLSLRDEWTSATSSLRPDIMLWCTPTSTVIMDELTVPWVVGMEA